MVKCRYVHQKLYQLKVQVMFEKVFPLFCIIFPGPMAVQDRITGSLSEPSEPDVLDTAKLL